MSEPVQLDASAVMGKLAAKSQQIIGQLMQENATLEAYVAVLSQQLAEATKTPAPDAFGDTSD